MRLTNDPPVLLDSDEAARVALAVRHPLNEIEAAAAWNRLLAHIDAQADLIRDLEDELGAMTVALRVAGSDLERQAERITELEDVRAALARLVAALAEEEEEHGFPFNFEARDALRAAAASLDGKDGA